MLISEMLHKVAKGFERKSDSGTGLVMLSLKISLYSMKIKEDVVAWISTGKICS